MTEAPKQPPEAEWQCGTCGLHPCDCTCCNADSPQLTALIEAAEALIHYYWRDGDEEVEIKYVRALQAALTPFKEESE